MSLSLVIMAGVQLKIEEESKKNPKKVKRRKKDEEEGKIVKENENSNYNLKSGRVKKEYLHLVRIIKIKIDYKTQYSQQEKSTAVVWNLSFCLQQVC